MINLRNAGNGMTNIEILEIANRLNLPNFKYYMRDELTGNPSEKECGIINLDNSAGGGTHHTCYWKEGEKKYYFDSFGVAPPNELIRYLKRPILYSTYQVQGLKDTNCSELSLHVLQSLKQERTFTDSVFELING